MKNKTAKNINCAGDLHAHFARGQNIMLEEMATNFPQAMTAPELLQRLMMSVIKYGMSVEAGAKLMVTACCKMGVGWLEQKEGVCDVWKREEKERKSKKKK